MKLAAGLFVLVLLLPGCQKIMEYYKPGNQSTQTNCRIKSYTYDYYGSIITTTFDYDSAGNPIKVTYIDEWLPDGQSKEIFTYDNLGRLIYHTPDEFMGDRRHYVYEGNSMVPLRDTAEDSWGNKYVESFKFDQAERIVAVEIRWVSAPDGYEEDPQMFEPERYRYFYDVHGNRQANPFDLPWHKILRYSNKPSLYSLHPTWQLVFRDYSRNNASKVGSYNQQGLPVSFIQSDFEYWQPFFDLSQNAVVTYDCRPAGNVVN